MSYAIIKKNAYYDSVTLMKITSQVINIPGVKEASICMGTELNKELIRSSGLSTLETQDATPNDLIIAFETGDDSFIDSVLKAIDEMLNKKNEVANTMEVVSVSLKTSLDSMPDANIAIISVPGCYAYIEAKKALLSGLNVMLFSDNLTIGEEKDLKIFAAEKGLLVMGPDCGTSIINGKGLCFANEIRRGNIGIIGASGTGLQEITVLIDHFGGGITQAIGVGGRDLSEDIGGIMMLSALEQLKNDTKTEVIILLSKQPAQVIADKVINFANNCQKPIVICFLGGDIKKDSTNRLTYACSLEEAAIKALECSGIIPNIMQEDLDFTEDYAKKFSDKQKYIRGIFCGGTLCAESQYILKNYLNVDIYSNISKSLNEKLEDPFQSKEHALLDLGDDIFTVGKPHPMIDPSIRNARIIQEAKDSEVAVLLIDFEIGYGSHEDPVGVALKSIEKAKSISPSLAVVAYVCGTEKDYQGYKKQKDALIQAGVIVASSNAQATRIAAELIRRKTL